MNLDEGAGLLIAQCFDFAVNKLPPVYLDERADICRHFMLRALFVQQFLKVDLLLAWVSLQRYIFEH